MLPAAVADIWELEDEMKSNERKRQKTILIMILCMKIIWRDVNKISDTIFV